MEADDMAKWKCYDCGAEVSSAKPPDEHYICQPAIGGKAACETHHWVKVEEKKSKAKKKTKK
jgi:hypothetical protein